MASRSTSLSEGLRRLVGRPATEPKLPKTQADTPTARTSAGIGAVPKVPGRVVAPLTADEQRVVDDFHKLYRSRRVDKATYFLGTRLYKCPLDLWVYQEMISELTPDVIIETGTLHGGSALYLATMLDLVDNGQIVSIDLSPKEGLPEHPRLTYLTGSSTAPDIVEQVRERCAGATTVMAIFDSDHRRNHVLDELRTYQSLVTPGSYMVVEDGNVNGHPVDPDYGPGPWEAVEDFLEETKDFELDPSREKHLLTMNPHGYLRKRR